MERRYPVDARGLPVCATELALPDSHLDLEERRNWNNHHKAFTRRQMGLFLLTQTYRDLTHMQQYLPRDQHGNLHRLHSSPKPPPLEVMMEEIERVKDNDNALQRYELLVDEPGYKHSYIDERMWQAIQDNYNELRG